MIWNHVESLSIFTYQPASIESSPQNNPSLVTSSAPLLAEWLVPSPAKKSLLASSSALSLQTPLSLHQETRFLHRPAFLGPSSSPFVATWPLVVRKHQHINNMLTPGDPSNTWDPSTTHHFLRSDPNLQFNLMLLFLAIKKRTKFSRHLLKDSKSEKLYQ